MIWLRAVALAIALATVGQAANTCTDTATGNWSAAGTWTSCGGTIPQPGDTVQISGGHTVTLDTDTNVASILINLINSKLVTNGVAHTVTMTIAASNCLTLRNKATLDTSAATAGNEVTFTCPNMTGTSQAVIAGQFASPFQGLETLKLYHAILIPSGGGDGIFVSNAFGSFTVDVRYCKQTGGTRFFSSTSALPNATFIGNTFDGLAGNAIAPQNGDATSWTVTDNTDINSATQGTLLKFPGNNSGGTFSRNAAFGTGVARTVYKGNNGSTTTATTISYNIGSTTSIGADPMLGYCAGASTAHCSYDHNVGELYFTGIHTNNSYIDLSYNIMTGNTLTGPGQGCYITLTGSHITSLSDVCMLDSNNGNIGWLFIGGGSDLVQQNGLYYMSTADSGSSFAISAGEGGGGANAFLLASVSNTIMLNKTYGIGANNASDTFVTTGTGSVGVFNNLSTGASSSDYYNPSSIASFGTSHPSATYGDVQLAPGVISVTRRLAQCDAIAFGGPGTTAHLFGDLAKRWNSTNTAAITPAAIWNCMAAPLSAQNTALATLGYGSTFVGPYKPKVIAAVVP